MKKLILTLTLTLFVSGLLMAADPVAVTGARLFTMTGEFIQEGVLLFEDGKITAVGASVTVPPNARILDAQGKTVMPGLIDGFTNLGIADLQAFGSDDNEAAGVMAPHLRVIDALNPQNRFLKNALSSGITAALCAPAEGALLSGQSALIQLKGATAEAMTLKFPAAITGSMGHPPKQKYGKNNQAPMTRMGMAAMLRQLFIDVQTYQNSQQEYENKLAVWKKEKSKEDKPAKPACDFKKSAMLPVIQGDLPLLLNLNRMDDMLTAIRIADEFGLSLIFGHAAESWKIAELLAEKKIPVVLGPLTTEPLLLETLDRNPESARILHEAGVTVAFQTGSIRLVSALLEQVAFAVRNGLPYDEALKGVTLYPAQLFGVSQRVGSLEPGKSADFIIFDGDPLTLQSQVESVYIAGEKVFGE